jgi:soluble lytic murein transglycosylase-like protein
MRISAFFLATLSLPLTATADCIIDAATYHHVNQTILYALAKHESRLNPSFIGKNKNGSIDIGLLGINSIHLNKLSKFGVTKERLLDPCVNAYVGAWLYSQKIGKYGNTWEAVGAYHSTTPHLKYIYITKIQSQVSKLISSN